MKRLTVQLSDVENNIIQIKSKADTAHVIAVLKADAYGLGAVFMAKQLLLNGISFFAVACIEEAAELREAGIDCEILLLTSSANEKDAEDIVKYNLTATIGTVDAGAVLNAVCERMQTKVNAHIEIDTGFGRSGFLYSEADKITGTFDFYTNVNITGVYTHLSCAFGKKKYTYEQYERFYKVRELILQHKEFNGIFHIANSTALFRFNEIKIDAVRVGSAITGRTGLSAKKTGLKPIGMLEADIKEIKWLPKGHNAGYGNAVKLKTAKRIAIVTLGYGDGVCLEKERGLFRVIDKLRYVYNDVKLGRKRAFHGILNEKKVYIIGRAGLSSMILDVTEIECHQGDVVSFAVSPMFVDKAVERKYV